MLNAKDELFADTKKEKGCLVIAIITFAFFIAAIVVVP